MGSEVLKDPDLIFSGDPFSESNAREFNVCIFLTITIGVEILQFKRFAISKADRFPAKNL